MAMKVARMFQRGRCFPCAVAFHHRGCEKGCWARTFSTSAETSSAADTSDNKGILKFESKNPDRHCFLQNVGRPQSSSAEHASVSNACEAFDAGGGNLLALDAHARWWRSCRRWLEPHVRGRPTRLIFRNSHLPVNEGDKLALVYQHGDGVVRRRSLGLLLQ